jgi:hypothetical protein
VPKRIPKEPQPLKDLPKADQAKLEWVKEIKGLLSNLNKDTNLFMKWKVKGQSLAKDKSSCVTKELLAAIEGGFKQLQLQGEAISEVLVLGSSVGSNDFSPKVYDKQVQQAKQVLASMADLRSKGLRIIGK